MSKLNLTIHVRAASGNVAIMDIHGEVTGFGENALMDAYVQASGQGARTVCLNFTDLPYHAGGDDLRKRLRPHREVDPAESRQQTTRAKS